MAKKKETGDQLHEKGGGEDRKPKGKEVEVSSLATLDAFTYQGEDYRKRRLLGGGRVNCMSIDGKKLLTLEADTLVTPK